MGDIEKSVADVSQAENYFQEIKLREITARESDKIKALVPRGYGLSTSYITQILQAENLLYPAGEVYNGSQKLSVTTDAQLSTVDEVANINIPLQTGGTVLSFA